MKYYILDAERRPVVVPVLEWARWFGDFHKRQVALDRTRFFEVSTVFLGLDHSWGRGPPILFETMVFERQRVVKEMFGRLVSVREDTEQRRYASWDDALTGHKTILRRLKKQEANALASTKAKQTP